MRHLLVAIDLSPAAHTVAATAARWAAALDANVTLVNIDEIHRYTLEPTAALSDVAAELEARRVAILEDAVAAFADLGVSCRTLTIVGRARDVVVQLCNEAAVTAADGSRTEVEPVDMAVLARASGSRARRFFLGSTTRHVVTHSDRPVMVVPVADPSKSVALDPPGQLVAPTDFSEDGRLGFAFALELADAIDGEVTLLHVAEVPGIGALGSDPVEWLPGTTAEHLERQALSKLAVEVDRSGSPRAAFLVRIDSHPDEGIIECAEELDADAVVVPSHGKGFFERLILGSTTLRLLAHATRPLIVVPRSAR